MATSNATPPANLPATGYIRQAKLIGESAVTAAQAKANRARGKGPKRPRSGSTPIIPVSSATWWRWIKSGKAPAPVRLGERVVAWDVEDIREFLDALAASTPSTLAQQGSASAAALPMRGKQVEANVGAQADKPNAKPPTTKAAAAKGAKTVHEAVVKRAGAAVAAGQ